MEYLTIETKYAKKYGIKESIVLHTFIYFILKNRHEKRNKHQGKYWTFNSYHNWKDNFPFFTEYQIRNAIRSLHKQGAIEIGNFNKKRYDKTNWYTISSEILQEAQASDYWNTRIIKSISKGRDKNNKPIPYKDKIIIEPY
tara:strand:- start:58 stop:480 length:423 start_codon:yes stop_codon:yes gene_type:complete